MKHANNQSKTATACATSLVCLILLASGTYGQGNKTSTVAAKPASADSLGDTKSVGVGSFAVNVPTEWAPFASSEAASLRRQYLEQNKQIYQQFSGSSEDPAKSVDVAAFHIAGDEGSFVIVSFTVPPQADLLGLLRSQVREKMDFGVGQGFIRRYLGMVTVNDYQLSGFYTKAIGKSGNVEVSGGLEHKKLKNTLIQLTLLSPNGWDETKATNSLVAVLKSVVIKQK